MTSDTVALQLYTLRDRAARDFPGTLREVARIGYRAVELAGLHGLPAGEVHGVLDELGLRAVSAHVPFQDEKELDEVRTLGCSYAVLPSLPENCRAPATAWATLTELGARARDAGLRFAYHNHAWELQTRLPGGETLLDACIERTDPELVAFEVDVHWAAAGGADPRELLDRHARRIELLHVKDLAPDGSDAPVGEGGLAWTELLAAASSARWHVVEQDEPRDPLVDVETSLVNLRHLLRNT